MTEGRTPLWQLPEKWRAEAERHAKHGDCYRRGQGWGLKDCANELEAALAAVPPAPTRPHFRCPDCGPCGVDEDSCCRSCGRDAEPVLAVPPAEPAPPAPVPAMREHTCHSMNPPFPYECQACAEERIDAALERGAEHFPPTSETITATLLDACKEALALFEAYVDEIGGDDTYRVLREAIAKAGRGVAHPSTLRVVVNGQPVEVDAGPVRSVIQQAIDRSGQIGAPIEQWELRTPEGETIPHDIEGDWHLCGGKLLFLNLGLPKAIPPAEPAPPDYRAQHLAHCYQGENEGYCKYGDDDCPAKPAGEPAPAPAQRPADDDINSDGRKWYEASLRLAADLDRVEAELADARRQLAEAQQQIGAVRLEDPEVCRVCGHRGTVIDSRRRVGYRRRVHRCARCKRTWKSYQSLMDPRTVLQHTGNRLSRTVPHD